MTSDKTRPSEELTVEGQTENPYSTKEMITRLSSPKPGQGSRVSVVLGREERGFTRVRFG